MTGKAPPKASPLIADEAVRAYDIRGVAGTQVTTAGVRRLGLACATRARAHGLGHVAVGRDGRLSSRALERALVRGLVEGGMQVLRIGLCPTPMLGFAVRRLAQDGGIMVTASHNPPHENGLKLLFGQERIHGEALKALVAFEGAPAPGGRHEKADVSAAYVEALAGAAEGMAPLKVAWDPGNGATGPIVRRLVKRLPGRHTLINAGVDGRFPHHHPDPAVTANLAQLQAAVLANGCDLGIAFDGDGDRIGVVDSRGEPLAADHLLLFLAQDLLARNPGAAIVGDVKCSRLLFEGVEQAGGRAVISPTGYVLVRQALQREGALLAGEFSGHVFYADDGDRADDALYAAMRLLKALSVPGRSLTAFRRGLPPSFATPELRIPCDDPPGVIRDLAARTPRADADPVLGVRLTDPDGWWLARASGTERKITCRCESGTAEGLARLKTGLFAQLRACGVVLAD